MSLEVDILRWVVDTYVEHDTDQSGRFACKKMLKLSCEKMLRILDWACP